MLAPIFQRPGFTGRAAGAAEGSVGDSGSGRSPEGDEAFIAIAVAKRLLNDELGARLLAFARAKGKSVNEIAVDAGVVGERQAARVTRLARYRVARAEDRIYAEVAAREGILTRTEAAAGLIHQRDLYAAGRGFIRLAALLRAEKQISRDDDRKIQKAVRSFQRARKSTCANAGCGALILQSDVWCPTCGVKTRLPIAQPSHLPSRAERQSGSQVA
jgi:hypothetical protein